MQIVSGRCVWYHTGLPVVPIQWVLIRDLQGKFVPQALLCTDLDAAPVQIVAWFVLRWQLETTFQAVRTHLGVETQRQWNDVAIVRTTPALFGLFSLVTLLAHQQARDHTLYVRQAAWYVKASPTFADALASVRWQLWRALSSSMYSATPDMQKLQQDVLEHLAETLCYAP